MSRRDELIECLEVWKEVNKNIQSAQQFTNIWLDQASGELGPSNLTRRKFADGFSLVLDAQQRVLNLLRAKIKSLEVQDAAAENDSE